jgi:hypothetical protein
MGVFSFSQMDIRAEAEQALGGHPDRIREICGAAEGSFDHSLHAIMNLLVSVYHKYPG